MGGRTREEQAEYMRQYRAAKRGQRIAKTLQLVPVLEKEVDDVLATDERAQALLAISDMQKQLKAFEAIIIPEFVRLKQLAAAGGFNDDYYKLKESFLNTLTYLRKTKESVSPEFALEIMQVEKFDDDSPGNIVETRKKFTQMLKGHGNAQDE